MRRVWILAVVLLLAARCGNDDSAVDTADLWPELPSYDTDGNGDVEPSDATVRGDHTQSDDTQTNPEVADDNTPPIIETLAPLTMPMGSSTTLDMAPLIHDNEDDKSNLALSWSAQHVALQEQDGHVVYIVAPVDWFGAEPILITVTDSGGLEDTQQLMVNVEEVIPPEPVDPPPPTDCEILFSYPADGTPNEVLLSGSFNNWGASANTAAVLADPDGDNTWEVTLELEPGTYQYKFIVDGNWIPDPDNNNTADDGYGGVNSVLEVPEGCE